MTKKTNTYESPSTETYSIANEGIICGTKGGTTSGDNEDDDM